MQNFFFLSTFIGALATVIAFMGIAVSHKILESKSKKSPFECGFSMAPNSSSPFSMQFFLIALIFLIFDVELILLFPAVIFLSSGFSMMLIFISALGVGAVIEWSQGALNWQN